MARQINRGSGGWVNRFWFALEYNDQRALRHMIAHGANVNHVFKEPGHRRCGQSPIFIAVSKNNRDLTSLLIAAGCDLEHANLVGETVLYVAIRQGKLPMVRQLLNAGANINHLNKKGENVLFLAIRWGRKDLVEFLVGQGCDINVISKDGTTPLVEALQLYENACSLRHATRRSAPSSMADIIHILIPLCSNLNHHHPNQGTALRIALNIETTHFRDKLTISKMLMQHGAVPDRLFYLRFGGLHASTSKPGSEFFTDNFFSLALLAGANLQREKTWLLTVLSEMSQELQPFEQLFQDLLEKAMSPPSLQTACLIAVRRHLGGQLWTKVDRLPLPATVQDCLKLKHL